MKTKLLKKIRNRFEFKFIIDKYGTEKIYVLNKKNKFVYIGQTGLFNSNFECFLWVLMANDVLLIDCYSVRGLTNKLYKKDNRKLDRKLARKIFGK